MFPLLPKFVLNNETPAFYETESGTAIEMVARMHGTINSLIEDYNNFVDNVNETIGKYVSGESEGFDLFKTSLRQEFQDFINVADLKITTFTGTINGNVNAAKTETNALLQQYQADLDIAMERINTIYARALSPEELAELRNMASTLDGLDEVKSVSMSWEEIDKLIDYTTDKFANYGPIIYPTSEVE